MIAIAYHADLKEVQADAALAALLAAPPSGAPFDRGAWFALLAEHCGLVPLLAVASDGDARAALVLHQRGNTLTSLANWYSFSTRPLLTVAATAWRC